jgi:hypothetical protein
MTQLAIIPRQQRDIARELSDCISCLENSGIHVYAIHRGQGYGVLWAENSAIARGDQVLRNAGFKAAPLTRTRSLKIKHGTFQVTTSAATTVSE